MGNSNGENGVIPHSVTLTKDYWLGKVEVTKAQFALVMHGLLDEYDETYKSFFSDDELFENHAVDGVSWRDAKRFCFHLNHLYQNQLLDGYKLDLPTEAQWE